MSIIQYDDALVHIYFKNPVSPSVSNKKIIYEHARVTSVYPCWEEIIIDTKDVYEMIPSTLLDYICIIRSDNPQRFIKRFS